MVSLMSTGIPLEGQIAGGVPDEVCNERKKVAALALTDCSEVRTSPNLFVPVCARRIPASPALRRLANKTNDASHFCGSVAAGGSLIGKHPNARRPVGAALFFIATR